MTIFSSRILNTLSNFYLFLHFITLSFFHSFSFSLFCPHTRIYRMQFIFSEQKSFYLPFYSFYSLLHSFYLKHRFYNGVGYVIFFFSMYGYLHSFFFSLSLLPNFKILNTQVVKADHYIFFSCYCLGWTLLLTLLLHRRAYWFSNQRLTVL